LIDKIKKAYKSTVDKSFMAATFAEAGEFDTAKKIMDKDDK